MKIVGLQKLTLLDYPEHVACTIFFGGCNLRCPFCHNMDLVLNSSNYEEISIDTILKFLEERKNKLEGVAITGGEPLINNDIKALLYEIKNLGFSIKLDTNGFYPKLLNEIINENLIDMVAMDIKSGFTNYSKVSGISFSNDDYIENLKESIKIIMNSNIDYEFRTTCVKGLHEENDFHEIKNMIAGAKKYFLQNYNEPKDNKIENFSPFSKEELENFVKIVSETIKNVFIRGVD